MTTKSRAFIPFLLLLSILLLSATLALSATEGEDPERERRKEQCMQECRESTQGEEQQRQCMRQCEQRYEQERRGQGEERSRGGGQREDPEKRLEECRRECREQEKGGREQKECEQRCEKEYREHRGEDTEDPEKRLEECRRECREQEKGWREQKECEQRCEKEYREHRGGNKEKEEREEGREEEKRRGSDPFFFDEESFVHGFSTDRGSLSLLRNFIEKSRLLLGVANYRLAILEVGPETFMIPRHFDAENIMFVSRGNGLITLTSDQHHTETYELSEGDLCRVRAGRIVSVTNTDGKKKLEIVSLVEPVGTPGMFESFVGAGGENPESFYRSFSDRILRAAFNV